LVKSFTNRAYDTAALKTLVSNSSPKLTTGHLSETDGRVKMYVKSFYDLVYKSYRNAWQRRVLTPQQLTAGLAAICKARVLQAILYGGTQDRGHVWCILAPYQCYRASRDRPNDPSTIQMIDAYFQDKKHNHGERSDFSLAIEAAMNSKPQVNLDSAAFRTFLMSRCDEAACRNYMNIFSS